MVYACMCYESILGQVFGQSERKEREAGEERELSSSFLWVKGGDFGVEKLLQKVALLKGFKSPVSSLW